MRRLLASTLLLAACAACSGAPPSADQRRATDLNPSGRPYDGPAVTRVVNPPADINTFNPLNCHPEGQGSVCGRS